MPLKLKGGDEIPKHDADISIRAGKPGKGSKGKDTVVSIDISIRVVKIAEHDDIGEGGAESEKAAADCSDATTKVLESEKAAADRSDAGKAIKARPVTWCEKSKRWRDGRGRYCRAPSPAAR